MEKKPVLTNKEIIDMSNELVFLRSENQKYKEKLEKINKIINLSKQKNK
jgi:hypothetical protein